MDALPYKASGAQPLQIVKVEIILKVLECSFFVSSIFKYHSYHMKKIYSA